MWRMFAVMLSTLQKSPKLHTMAYQGKMLFFFVYFPLSKQSLAWQIAYKGEWQFSE